PPGMSGRVRLALGGAAACLAAAGLTCGPGAGPEGQGARAAAADAAPSAGALVPDPAGPLSTSLAAVVGAPGATLAAVDTRAGRPPDVYAQQQASAHADSSFNNPVYRVAIERMREEVGHAPIRMCGGCHDI